MRRSLERTSLMAVLLGYGLLLYVNLTLQPLQQKQRQERAFEHAKTILRDSESSILRDDSGSSSGQSIDTKLLQ